ncbi:hypothetical protein GJAV_G00170790 [Gymnothorax javanicus]|nr:hypothetical protein GJAV_G00170790 [Gymnothorax javanicus]
MFLLEGTKFKFRICLALCVLICSAIYLKAKVTTQPTARHNPPSPTARYSLITRHSLSAQNGPHTTEQPPGSCKPLAQECQRLLGTGEGVVCQCDNCLNEANFTAPNFTCSHLARDLHFITTALSKEEEEYPLAFIITIHKELEMFARLLRAVYAPQNVYCIHVDGRASPSYRAVVERLASCFPNVFLASVSEKVTYAGFSRLQADINCMRDLAVSPLPWKRVINLCGQDFPILSNLELVRLMRGKQWRDRNLTPGVKQPQHMRYRTETQYQEITGLRAVPKVWGRKKGPPPHNLQIYFGTAYYSLTKPFVDFVLRSQVARDLLEWSKDTYSPDEHYWVTLNHLADAPGNHVNGGWEGNIRAIKWRDQAGRAHDGCKGKYVRDICVYGLGDLQWIVAKNSMFANKFSTSTFSEAVDCMEQWHRRKVLRQAEVPINPRWRMAKLTQKSPEWQTL